MLYTASAVISYTTKLEEETAEFYEKLAQKYPEKKDFFLLLSKENRKNKLTVERTYYSVITDALEAGYAFKDGLNSEAYTIKTELAKNASYIDALRTAIESEKTIQKLYSDSADLSKDLMADVPRIFKIIATKRSERITKLKTLMEEKK